MSLNRLLLVAPAAFPTRTVQAIRPTQLAKHLTALGWDVTLATRADSSGTVSQSAALRRLDPRLKHVPIGRAAVAGESQRAWRARFKKLVYHPLGLGQMRVPDRFVAEWRRSLKEIDKLQAAHKYDAVLTSGPPHSIHLIGDHLKSRHGLGWIADFRDPWNMDDRFSPRGIAKLQACRHHRFEGRIYQTADFCTFAIPAHREWALESFPGIEGSRLQLVLNGIPDEMIDGSIAPSDPPASRHSIRLVGSACDLHLASLGKTVLELCNKDSMDIELLHAGVEQPAQQQLKAVLGERFTATGPIAHQDALRLILGASVNICSLDKRRSRGLGVSSKLFEYLAARKPIIVINATKSDRELFGRYRLISFIEERELADLAYRIKAILQDPPSDETDWHLNTIARRSDNAKLISNILAQSVE